MEEKKKEMQPYVKPQTSLIALHGIHNILAGSPPVQPGGGGGGSVAIIPPEEDEEDTEIQGAKSFSLWQRENSLGWED